MFDIGWSELILIGIVALIVVGPEDLPGMFRKVGRFMGRARGMAREFQRSMEEAADQSGLKEATKGLNDLNSIGNLNPGTAARNYAKDVVTGGSDAKTADAASKPASGDAKAAAKTAAPKAKAEPKPAAAKPAAKPKSDKPKPKPKTQAKDAT